MPSLVVGTTAVQLSSSTITVNNYTLIKAAAENTVGVYIGYANTVTANSNAATDGMELSTSEAYQVPKHLASSPSGIYLIASAADQKVFFDVT